MLEMEKHHFATITLTIGSGQSHQWMPHPGGNQQRAEYLQNFKVSPHRLLTSYKGEKRQLSYSGEIRQYFEWEIKINLTSEDQCSEGLRMGLREKNPRSPT